MKLKSFIQVGRAVVGLTFALILALGAFGIFGEAEALVQIPATIITFMLGICGTALFVRDANNDPLHSRIAAATDQIMFNPNDVDAYIVRAKLKRNAWPKGALHDLNRAIELDPSSAQALVLRGDTYVRLRKYLYAIEDYDRALPLVEDEALRHVIYYNRGRLHLKAKRLEPALSDSLEALKLKPDDPDTLYNIGIICEINQQYEEALTYFRQALEFVGLGDHDPSPASHVQSKIKRLENRLQ